MTLIGPFSLDIQPGSTSSSLADSVLVVSASLVEAAESITLFASTSIDGDTARLQGTLDLGVANPFFRTLTVPGGDPVEQTGSQIAVGINQAVVIDPVPAVVGFRVLIDDPASITLGFSLMGRTAPFTTGTIVVENTASVFIENTASVVVENTASVVVENTASVTIDAQPIRITGSLGGGPDIVVTGSMELVGQPIDVTGSVGVTEQQSIVLVTGSVAIVAGEFTQSVDARIVGQTVTQSVILDEPVLITGSVEVVASTGSVTIDEQPVLVTGSMAIVGEPIDVTGSVAIVDISQAEPVLITGSVFTAASEGATQSISIVDSRVTQSVDLVFGDTVNVTNTQSIIIQGRAAPDSSPGTSPGGIPLQTFASMSRT